MNTHISVVPPAGRHGGDGPAVARALGTDPASLLDLSQNLNPFAPDVAAPAARHLGELRRYPDPAAATRLLADAMGTDPGRLVLTNGAAEAISLVAAEIGGRVHSEPEFGLHPRGDSGPIWRSDPHNPSGRLAGPGETADVWDEAFYALATGRWTARRTGIAVGSLTKTFACPGLRLGYLIADDVERFARRQPQWSVGSLPLALLADLLEHADPAGWATAIAAARGDLVALLEAHGFAVQAVDAPWVLVEAPGLREALAPHGVLVRDCAGFGLDGTARVAVPDAAGLERLAAALDGAKITPPSAGTVSGGEGMTEPVASAGATRTPEHGATGAGRESGPGWNGEEPAPDRRQVAAIVFDVGDTLVHAAAPGTPVEALRAVPIGEALEDLRRLRARYRLAALTDTSVMTGDQVRRALQPCGLAELLELIITSVDVGAAKPDPRGLQLVMQQLGVSPERTLFVGDADVDEGTAVAAGTHFVRAGGGRSPGELIEDFLG